MSQPKTYIRESENIYQKYGMKLHHSSLLSTKVDFTYRTEGEGERKKVKKNLLKQYSRAYDYVSVRLTLPP